MGLNLFMICLLGPWGSTTAATLDEVTGKRKRKCKRRRRKKPDPAKCKTYEFGCCWDNETEAKGPFGEGESSVVPKSLTEYFPNFQKKIPHMKNNP